MNWPENTKEPTYPSNKSCTLGTPLIINLYPSATLKTPLTVFGFITLEIEDWSGLASLSIGLILGALSDAIIARIDRFKDVGDHLQYSLAAEVVNKLRDPVDSTIERMRVFAHEELRILIESLIQRTMRDELRSAIEFPVGGGITIGMNTRMYIHSALQKDTRWGIIKVLHEVVESQLNSYCLTLHSKWDVYKDLVKHLTDESNKLLIWTMLGTPLLYDQDDIDEVRGDNYLTYQDCWFRDWKGFKESTKVRIVIFRGPDEIEDYKNALGIRRPPRTNRSQPLRDFSKFTKSDQQLRRQFFDGASTKDGKLFFTTVNIFRHKLDLQNAQPDLLDFGIFDREVLIKSNITNVHRDGKVEMFLWESPLLDSRRRVPDLIAHPQTLGLFANNQLDDLLKMEQEINSWPQ